MALLVAEQVDLRCPGNVPWSADSDECTPGHLLARLRIAGEKPSFVHPENLIEMACPDCKRDYRRLGRPVKRVLHRYNMLGELLETLIQED
jgi:hypothetical protein